MFDAVRQRFSDARTIKALCLGAERHANERGQQEPGAEHFVLAALELPDGTARQAFARVQRDPDEFAGAIDAQYRRALESAGVDPEQAAGLHGTHVAIPAATGPYAAKPSAEALMQVLTREVMTEEHRRDVAMPLLGAHVLIAAAAAQFGVCARALRELDIEPSRLAATARDVIDGARALRARTGSR